MVQFTIYHKKKDNKMYKKLKGERRAGISILNVQIYKATNLAKKDTRAMCSVFRKFKFQDMSHTTLKKCFFTLKKNLSFVNTLLYIVSKNGKGHIVKP